MGSRGYSSPDHYDALAIGVAGMMAAAQTPLTGRGMDRVNHGHDNSTVPVAPAPPPISAHHDQPEAPNHVTGSSYRTSWGAPIPPDPDMPPALTTRMTADNPTYHGLNNFYMPQVVPPAHLADSDSYTDTPSPALYMPVPTRPASDNYTLAHPSEPFDPYMAANNQDYHTSHGQITSTGYSYPAVSPQRLPDPYTGMATGNQDYYSHGQIMASTSHGYPAQRSPDPYTLADNQGYPNAAINSSYGYPAISPLQSSYDRGGMSRTPGAIPAHGYYNRFTSPPQLSRADVEHRGGHSYTSDFMSVPQQLEPYDQSPALPASNSMSISYRRGDTHHRPGEFRPPAAVARQYNGASIQHYNGAIPEGLCEGDERVITLLAGMLARNGEAALRQETFVQETNTNREEGRRELNDYVQA